MPANSNGVPKPTSRRLELFTWLAAFWLIALVVPACLGQNAAAAKPQAVPADAPSQEAVAKLRMLPTPSGVYDILEIHPFRLKMGYHHDWLESRPFVSEGLLVVLRVDPSLVVPRNTAEPVLYAGDRTVQRLNKGNVSGFVIGIIPGNIDLATAPIWFGRPELPERVTPDVIVAERSLADSVAIKPFSPEKIAAAQRDPIIAGDLASLLRGPAADLVLKYSPDEKDLAETWRLPSAGTMVPR